MIRMVGISGSLRAGSYNSALLRAAVKLAPDGAQLDIASVADIPLYNGDVEENEGIPTSVQTLKDRVAGADGLLLASPEYNNSVPGVLKNAIDWLSRPPADQDRVFADKPVAMMGASRGPKGTVLAQVAWLPIFRALKMRPYWAHALYVDRAQGVFDDYGRLADTELEKRLGDFVGDFVEFIGMLQGTIRA